MLSVFTKGRNVLRMYNSSVIWKNYSRSMNKRRPGLFLGQNAFGRYMSKFAYCYCYGESIVLGQFDENNRFWISHFAPSSRRDGVKMLKQLTSSVTVGFAVTEDLVGMLEKLGLKVVGSVESEFRGFKVVKTILIN